ncbi:predicted protein [Chaetomium globosum CBS 148.51]|uniref:SGNH hydrolase-type esterase domain-containing protein n=1 Tax=Chaetomium globosum (strain ATCC 6205 / CBS 148.51 / DSM 1962 / NBRC 6347 / NRRL 1970) TaxID=306901 RepID=Q2H8A4_CHAGB|nr:uncharacterized protein CHGG_03550 [Chaetomium globosum CBS 148.51]EAQ91615.1 predicted protein [Chaetomium globosum CBS 148.51]
MADTPQTNSQSAPSTSPPPPSPHPPFPALRSIAKFKARSHATSKDIHIPLLHQIQSQPPANDNNNPYPSPTPTPKKSPTDTSRLPVRVWVVQVGTNNLTVKTGLGERDVDAWEVLVETLLGVNPTGGECKVLVTGLFYRKDVSGELVDQANGKIRAVVKRLQEKYGADRVVCLAPAAGVKTEEHLVDHVHLNLEGYQLWMAELFPAVNALLG